MPRDFTDEDRDLPVITAEGNRIGTVTEVNDGRATVETTDEEHENLSDDVRDMLGWDDEGTNELRSEDVDTTGKDEIRLRSRGP